MPPTQAAPFQQVKLAAGRSTRSTKYGRLEVDEERPSLKMTSSLKDMWLMEFIEKDYPRNNRKTSKM